MRYFYHHIIIGFFLSIIVIAAKAQSLTCNQTIQISLQEHSCSAIITADIILENPQDGIDYVIEITKPDGRILENQYVGLDEVDELLVVKIQHPLNGNSCWSNVTVENKIMPQIHGCLEMVMPCNSYPDTLQHIEHMTYDYGCGNYHMYFQDSTVHFQCALDGMDQIIYRKWYIENSSFSTYVCTQKMMFQRHTLDNIFFPPNFDDQEHPAINCDYHYYNNEYVRFDSIEFLDGGHPSTKPYPYGTGTPGGESCKNLNTSFQDTRFNSCGNNVKILRSWIILDWCTGEQMTRNQTIQLKDTYGPILKCSQEPMEVVSDIDGCQGSIKNMEPTFIARDCSSFTYKVSIKPKDHNDLSYDYASDEFVELLDNGNFSIVNVPQDTIWVIYTVTDDCGHSSQCHTEMIVKDNEPPIALCEHSTVVTLGDNGYAPLYASGLDNYSYDNCGISYYEIKRLGSSCYGLHDDNEFSDYIEFCCEDVDRSPIKVAIRIYDLSGNYSDCWMNVNVQDKNPPIIKNCPSDMNLHCDQDTEDLILTGEPEINELCGFHMEYEDDLTGLNDCGIGILSRTWIVYNSNGDFTTCIQQLTIEEKYPLTESNIHWPENIELNHCFGSQDDLDVTGEPWFDAFDCKNLFVDYKDETFYNLTDACTKILRTWRVTDWCQYDYEQTGVTYFWENIQQIKIIDRTRPQIISTCENLEYQADASSCSANVLLEMKGEDECDKDQLIFEYEIDYDFEGSFVADETIESSNINQDFNTGTHKIRFKLSDFCGNFEKCEFSITIHPSSDFQPICISELSLSLGVSGEIEIWASDFIKDVNNSCGPQSEVNYSFSETEYVPAINISCLDFEDGDGLFLSREQTVYVSDQFGNQSSCNVSLLVNDNFNKCSVGTGSSILITGKVQSEINEGIQSVPLRLFDMITGSEEVSNTLEDGSYVFNNLIADHNYEMTGDDFGEITDGLSSLDLVVLQRHILGIEELKSPYKLLAGDVDGSGQITINDLVSLRKVLLGLSDQFPVNKIWSIFDSNQVMLEGEVPTNVEEEVYIQGVQSNVTEIDLMAVKIGDVNNSYSGTNKTKHINQVVFEMESRFDQLSRKHWIDIYTSEDLIIAGFQMSLIIDSGIIKNVIGESLHENENYIITENELQFAVVFEKSKRLDKNQLLFSIEWERNQSTLPMLHLDEDFTSELYLDRDYIRSVQMKINPFQKETDLQVTVSPNPFIEEVHFNFNVAESQNINIILYDASGKLIYNQTSLLSAGNNSVKLDGSMVKESGLMFYEIQSLEKIFSGKIIKM